MEEPSSCDKINYKTSFITVAYKNIKQGQKINSSYCKFLGKGQYLMRPGGSKKKLYRLNKDFNDQMLAASLFFLFGIFMTYKGFKQYGEIKKINKPNAE